MLRPDPRPLPPSRAITTHGRRQRSTSREATIPTTPGCQPSPATTIAAWWAWAAPAASAANRIRVSASWRSRFRKSSSFATSLARAGSSVRRSSSAASARCMRPAALIRGPEPEAQRLLGELTGGHAAHLHQRPQPRLPRAPQLHQPLAHDAPVLAAQRHQVADRRERREVDVLRRGCRVTAGGGVQRLAQLQHHARGAQLRGSRTRPAPDGRRCSRAASRPAGDGR